MVVFLATIFTLPSQAYAATLASVSAATENPYTGATGATYDWGFTAATTATLPRAQMTVPAGTSGAVGARYLDLKGISGNSAGTPDSASNSITGDIDLRAQAAFTNWSSGANQRLITKWGNSPNRSYYLSVNPSGALKVSWSPDGTTQLSAQSTASVPFGNGTAGWLRVTLAINNGLGGNTAAFYTSANGASWAQLGSTVITAGTTSIYDSAAALQIGEDAGLFGVATGKIYYAEVRNGIGGTVVNKFDPNESVVGSTSWAASTGETWTVNRSGTNLPADIASDLTVTSVSGLPSTGTARVRTIDKAAIYVPTTPASVPAGTTSTISLSGFTNTQTPGNYMSTITTYDNAATPLAVDTATASSLNFFTPPSNVLTSSSTALSDSRPWQGAVSYTTTASSVTLTATRCLKVNFSTNAARTGTKPAGMSVSGATLDPASTWAASPASWTVANDDVSGTVTLTYASGATPTSSSGRTLTLAGITNPTLGGSYFATVATYGNVDCATTPLDTITTAFAVIDGVAITATINPMLVFSVTGYNSGTCNGAALTASSSTAGAVPLGHLTDSTNAIAGQTLNISSNAGGGFSVLLRYTGALTNGNGQTISDSTGTNASPATFPTAGTPAFGYTTDHPLSGSATRFQVNKWAALTTGGAEVLYEPAAYQADVAQVCFQAGISSSTPPGAYSTTVVYTALANF